ncbi:hypothetical protein DV515_00006565 [Chloebia gouldiae]|uniref:Ig-like domain-containing protein n=1 Tax=Chloebia gouldiae TaxID=44316 RepID=A0A3L8SL04_CHLGU|nr:hypothetical protein DV515_00006565 [Chloebia gouldiae]
MAEEENGNASYRLFIDPPGCSDVRRDVEFNSSEGGSGFVKCDFCSVGGLHSLGYILLFRRARFTCQTWFEYRSVCLGTARGSGDGSNNDFLVLSLLFSIIHTQQGLQATVIFPLFAVVNYMKLQKRRKKDDVKVALSELTMMYIKLIPIKGTKIEEVEMPSSDTALLQVTISLSKVELSVGESKFFTCTAIGEPESIDWYNPQGEKIVSSQRVVVQKEGVRSRLTIYNANIEDAGIYRCQAADAKGQTQEATVVLEIYQKLTFRDIVSPQEFRQGEDAEVVCRVTSSPAPIVSWLYRNEEVTTLADNRFAVLANNNLQILKINKSDEGVYRCEGRVEARGEIDFRDIIVIVNVPPAIILLQKSFNATADRGEAITLFCRATGSPPPEISWYRNGKLVEENEKYVLRGSNTQLIIRDIKNIDADVPSNPYGVRVLELSQTTAKVSFNKPDSHGGVPIHHYQVDVKEVASETWKIVRSHGVQREPSPPSIHGQPESGKSFKLSITKQDDGGAPILEYIVKYRSAYKRLDERATVIEKRLENNIAVHVVSTCEGKSDAKDGARDSVPCSWVLQTSHIDQTANKQQADVFTREKKTQGGRSKQAGENLQVLTGATTKPQRNAKSRFI